MKIIKKIDAGKRKITPLPQSENINKPITSRLVASADANLESILASNITANTPFTYSAYVNLINSMNAATQPENEPVKNGDANTENSEPSVE